MVRFDPSVGAEIQKTRPAVILQVDGSARVATTIAAPITDWKSFYIFYASIVQLLPTGQNGLKKVSGVDASQVKSLDNSRFERKLGELSTTEMIAVEGAIAFCMGLRLQKL